MTETVESLAKPAYESLDEQKQQMLSKVLFPETLTDTVTVLGKERTLHPLPIKWTKKLHARLSPVTDKITKAQGDPTVNIDYTEDLCNGLMQAVLVLCEFYKDWDDIVEAIKEEEVLVQELQELVVTQRSVQGTSDFTFQSCSVMVGLMQLSEIGVTLLMSALSSPAMSSSTTAA